MILRPLGPGSYFVYKMPSGEEAGMVRQLSDKKWKAVSFRSGVSDETFDSKIKAGEWICRKTCGS